MTHISRIDDKLFDRIDDELRARAVELVEYIIGEKPTGGAGDDVRFRSKGSISVNVGQDRGRIRNFEADSKGKSPLQFIAAERGISMPEAIREGAAWLGIDLGEEISRDPVVDDELRESRRRERAERDRTAAADHDRRVRYARRLYAKSVPIDGTPAQVYLNGRGITRWPDSIKYHPGKRALIAPLTDDDGTIPAVHLVYLNADGSAVTETIKDVTRKKKRTNGPMGAAAIRLPGDTSKLITHEGPENALSTWMATGVETWAVCSSGRFGSIPTPDRPIVIARDRDQPDSPADRAVRKAAQDLVDLGRSVSIATPALKDANDILIAGGEDAVRAYIASATPFRAAWTSTTTNLPVYYPAPEQSREDALASMRKAMMGWGKTALRQAQANKEGKEHRQAAHDEIALDGGSTGDKAAASRRINDEVRQKYGVRLDRGERIQIASPAGAGKTTFIADMIKAHPGLMDHRLWIMVPTHDKASEIVIDFAAKDITATAIRGRAAPRPDDPDTAMCERSAVTERVARAGLPVEELICRSCPLRDGCAYQHQKTDAPGVYVLSHEYLTVPRSPVGTPDILIVDEAHYQTIAAKPEIGFDRLSQVVLLGAASAAADYRATAIKVRQAIEDKPEAILAAVREVVTTDDLKDARKYLNGIEESIQISGDMSDQAIMGLLDKRVSLDLHLVARLFSILIEEIEQPRKEANGISVVQRRDGRRIKLHYLKPLASVSKAVPVMILDASADLEINRRIWSADLRDETARIERNAHVTQVTGRNFSRASLIGIGDDDAGAGKLRDQTRGVIQRIVARHGRALVVTYKDLDGSWAVDGAHSAHFGALRGLNAYEDIPAAIVIGREQPLEQAEAIARALHADDAEPIMQLDHAHWRTAYTQTRRYRMRDGSIHVAEVRVHPDPRVQRVLEQIREREIEQAIDRIRLVHNVEPKHVYILCNIPVDVTVDRLMTWKEMRNDGSRFERLAAEDGLVPMNAAMMHRMRPDLWVSIEVAKKDFRRGHFANRNLLAECPHLKPAEFRQLSSKRWSRLFYDPGRYSDVETALRERLGVEIEVRGVDPPDDEEIMTDHAPIEPDDDVERLAIMVIDGELEEIDALNLVIEAAMDPPQDYDYAG